MANWLTRALGWAARVPEGAYRPGPYLLSNGWLPAGTSVELLAERAQRAALRHALGDGGGVRFELCADLRDVRAGSLAQLCRTAGGSG